MAQELHITTYSHARGQGPDRDTLILAAVLLSEDTLTDHAIATYLGISRRTLARWKHRDDMCLALASLRQLQLRMWSRQYPKWWNERELGPMTDDTWQR